MPRTSNSAIVSHLDIMAMYPAYAVPIGSMDDYRSSTETVEYPPSIMFAATVPCIALSLLSVYGVLQGGLSESDRSAADVYKLLFQAPPLAASKLVILATALPPGVVAISSLSVCAILLGLAVCSLVAVRLLRWKWRKIGTLST
ncbi:hypothetical protein C8F01DRAFT_1264906 [Mycena amicta]|nr:hypothetical protein C8F01DRAFT_1264906 [Mycena amicta]